MTHCLAVKTLTILNQQVNSQGCKFRQFKSSPAPGRAFLAVFDGHTQLLQPVADLI